MLGHDEEAEEKNKKILLKSSQINLKWLRKGSLGASVGFGELRD